MNTIYNLFPIESITYVSNESCLVKDGYETSVGHETFNENDTFLVCNICYFLLSVGVVGEGRLEKTLYYGIGLFLAIKNKLRLQHIALNICCVLLTPQPRSTSQFISFPHRILFIFSVSG